MTPRGRHPQRLPLMIQRQSEDHCPKLPEGAQTRFAARIRQNRSKAAPATEPEHLGEEQSHDWVFPIGLNLSRASNTVSYSKSVHRQLERCTKSLRTRPTKNNLHRKEACKRRKGKMQRRQRSWGLRRHISLKGGRDAGSRMRVQGLDCGEIRLGDCYLWQIDRD
jgi:hypothetical protein